MDHPTDNERHDKMGATPNSAAEIGFDSVQMQLDKILASKAFFRSERMIRFLRYAVEQAAKGQGDKLKEYTLGVEVFDRRESFDPRIDAVVRVEARRVRTKLEQYYETEGRQDPVLIELPKGSYVPVFRRREIAAASPARIWPRLRFLHGWKLIVMAATLVSVGLATYWFASPFGRSFFLPKRGETDAAKGRLETAVSARGLLSSIVTLPFVDLSPQKDQEYICDGLTDELISALTKVEGLRVLSQSSAFQFKGKIEDVRKIGELLNVDTVLQGSVRRAGNQLRVTVQLISVADGYYLWSETYERDMKDLFAIQKEISRAIVGALRFHLAGEQYKRLAQAYTASPKAYDIYLKGRYYWNKRTEEGLRQSVEYFQQAIVEDPNYALGYAALADAYALLASYGFSSPKEVMLKAKAAALKALEIDDTLGEAHASLGFVKSFYDWEWLEAEREYKRALELNPGYATGHQWYSSFLRATGKFNEALEEMKRAQELDPLSPAIGRDFGRIYSSMRRHEQAIEQYRKTLELNPSFPSGYLHLGLAYEHMSRYDEAMAAFQKARALPGGNPLIVAGLGHCYALMGNRVKAQQLLGELIEQSKRRYVPAVDIALIHIGLGEKDQAFKWLEKAYEEHDGWLAWLKVDPVFDGLRQDSRFLPLLRKVHFEAD